MKLCSRRRAERHDPPSNKILISQVPGSDGDGSSFEREGDGSSFEGEDTSRSCIVQVAGGIGSRCRPAVWCGLLVRFRFLTKLLDYSLDYEVFYFYGESKSSKLASQNTETVGVALSA
jgi:hypothetical protein